MSNWGEPKMIGSSRFVPLVFMDRIEDVTPLDKCSDDEAKIASHWIGRPYFIWLDTVNDQNSSMTPLQIIILIHYYGSRSDYREGDFSAPAVRTAIDFFVSSKLLEADLETQEIKRQYKITERGSAYVDCLCATPLPVQHWVRPAMTQRVI